MEWKQNPRRFSGRLVGYSTTRTAVLPFAMGTLHQVHREVSSATVKVSRVNGDFIVK